jgi:hypothetical protein
MFYCRPCATKNQWPETMSQSQGRCEVCGSLAVCNDRPARLLPEPPAPELDYNTHVWDAMMGYRPGKDERGFPYL